VSSSVQQPRAGRYGSGVSRKSIVGTPASLHGSKAAGVACLESMNWLRVTGARQVYLSHIGGCAPDRVIWLATLLQRGVRDGIIVASNSRVRGALWKALYVQDESEVLCLVSNYIYVNSITVIKSVKSTLIMKPHVSTWSLDHFIFRVLHAVFRCDSVIRVFLLCLIMHLWSIMQLNRRIQAYFRPCVIDSMFQAKSQYFSQMI
jgi:hypothetical protein